MTLAEIYEQRIKPLPVADRLRLATLILNDIPLDSVVDDRDTWSADDLRDFSAAGWDRLDEATDDAATS